MEVVGGGHGERKAIGLRRWEWMASESSDVRGDQARQWEDTKDGLPMNMHRAWWKRPEVKDIVYD